MNTQALHQSKWNKLPAFCIYNLTFYKLWVEDVKFTSELLEISTKILSFSLLPFDWKWEIISNKFLWWWDCSFLAFSFFCFSHPMYFSDVSFQCISQMYSSNDEIAVSWLFHFSVIPLLPLQCISSLISRGVSHPGWSFRRQNFNKKF